MTILLSNDDVAALLSVPDCIEVLEGAYAELARGRGINRTRSDSIVAHAGNDEAVYSLKSMDGIIPSLGVGAVRINSDIVTWPMVGNSQRRTKVPAADGRWVGLVLLFSTETGEPLAIMPDGVMQRIRVAAANGIGAKYMARADASDVAIIGSGWQAGTQLMAACAVRNVKRIRCWSTTAENRESFSAEMSDTLGIAVEPVTSAEAAVTGADIVLCATSSIDPVYFEQWVRPGVHLSSIKKAEIDTAVLKRCDRIALHVHEDKPLHFIEAGAKVAEAEGDKGWADKGDVDFGALPTVTDLVTGAYKGREKEEEITAFLNNLGMGYQFAAAGALVYRKAKEQGVGRDFPTEWFTQDVHP